MTPTHPLPEAFRSWIREAFLATDMTAADMRALARNQRDLWAKEGNAHAFPGYTSPPPDGPGSDYPSDWTHRAFIRLRYEAAQDAQRITRANCRR